MFRGHYQILCGIFCLFFFRCKIVMELVVQNERTGYYESTQVYLTVSVVYPAKLTSHLTGRKVRLLGILIQHPFIRKVLYKYFRICHFGLLNLDLYLCSWRRSMSEYLYLEYIYFFRVLCC